MKGYIYSDGDEVLFGNREIIGFGSGDFHVKKIERDLAYEIIEKNHYSGKGDSKPHNKLNLGVFIKGVMLGVLQFGLSMNPKSCSKVVKGTEMDQHMELNRMWLCDTTCNNAKSRSISYAVKIIKRIFNEVKWIQSFADERCDKFGIVYQASNFSYYGENTGIFYKMNDGEIIHQVTATNKGGRDISDAEKLTYRQFRYIYWIDRKWNDRCLLEERDYPKHYLE